MFSVHTSHSQWTDTPQQTYVYTTHVCTTYVPTTHVYYSYFPSAMNEYKTNTIRVLSHVRISSFMFALTNKYHHSRLPPPTNGILPPIIINKPTSICTLWHGWTHIKYGFDLYIKKVFISFQMNLFLGSIKKYSFINLAYLILISHNILSKFLFMLQASSWLFSYESSKSFHIHKS